MKKYIGITIVSIGMAVIGNLVDKQLGVTWGYAFAFLWGAITVAIGVSVMELLDT